MIVAFSVTPLGVGEDVGEYVADAVRVVRESGLPHRTDAMAMQNQDEPLDEDMAMDFGLGVYDAEECAEIFAMLRPLRVAAHDFDED